MWEVGDDEEVSCDGLVQKRGSTSRYGLLVAERVLIGPSVCGWCWITRDCRTL